ncbi:MAG: hypothetical protein AAF889_13010, partial [Cyanobacteria bacterium P01_D01_bin.73]
MTSTSNRSYSSPFSISHTLRYGIVALVTGSVIAVGGLTTWFSYESQLKTIRNLKQVKIEKSSKQVGFFLENLKNPLDYLSQFPGVAELDPEQQLQFLRGIVESNDAYFSMAIVQKDGNVSSAIAPFSSDQDQEINYLINYSGVSWREVIETEAQVKGPVRFHVASSPMRYAFHRFTPVVSSDLSP